jgi:Protein of unknown function (DUF3592)
MFDDLYDSMTKLLSWRWPTCQGEVTAVDIDPLAQRRYGPDIRLAVAYRFSVGDDGPYTGELFWEALTSASVLAAKDNIVVGQSVTVRYRRDNPSVNTLDTRGWRDF